MKKITRISPLTKKIETRNLNITDQQWISYCDGGYIQDVFSHLSPGDREFILTGYTESDWEKMFPKEDEDGE